MAKLTVNTGIAVQQTCTENIVALPNLKFQYIELKDTRNVVDKSHTETLLKATIGNPRVSDPTPSTREDKDFQAFRDLVGIEVLFARNPGKDYGFP